MSTSTPPVLSIDAQKRTLAKVTRRIVPLLIIGYFISYVDRVNISFAKLGMEQSFSMTAAQYGFAAGIFFAGYLLAEIPSNILMVKFGARVWLSRIMITWGIVGALMSLAPNVEVLSILRFLLGVAEAGFFPGILLYLTRWYPNKDRAKVVATVMMAIPLAGLIGSPLNGWILDTFDGVLGLESWRWVFIIGGIPAILVGIVYFIMIADSPEKAKWLKPEERQWLQHTLKAEDAERTVSAPKGHLSALKNKKVIVLAAIYFLLQCGSYPLTYWMPSVIKDVTGDLSSTAVGWLNAIPFLFAAICMFLVGRLVKDEKSSRPVLIALIISTVAFGATALTLGNIPMMAFMAITVATMAVQTSKPLFWNLPTSFLAGVGAASGIALINSLGNTAGFFSPYAVGWIQDLTVDSGMAVIVMIIAQSLAVVLIVGLVLAGKKQKAAQLASGADPALKSADAANEADTVKVRG